MSNHPGTGYVERYRALRARTAAIYDLLAPEAYLVRPIPLRHPFVFYEGHLAAFVANTLFDQALGEPALNASLDRLFARGIDPADEVAAARVAVASWPERPAVLAYGARIEEHFCAILTRHDAARPEHPWLAGGALFELIFEHELMHQETLMYLLRQLPQNLKRRPGAAREPDLAPALAPYRVDVPAGTALLGARPGEYAYAWDNELQASEVAVPAFAIDAYNVTNAQFQHFVEAGGYRRRELWDDAGWAWRQTLDGEHPHFWRRNGAEWRLHGVFGESPLPPAWPVCVSQAEAQAYARFVGRDLPTEAEWHRATYGERQDDRYPWGDAPPAPGQGHFDFQGWEPVPVGSYPGGRSPCGAFDLVGNGWEWTATPFAPFKGFRADPAYPRYSADFFDGKHFVLKGAGIFTHASLTRRSFRNWFYGHYPYMDATFRCVDR